MHSYAREGGWQCSCVSNPPWTELEIMLQKGHKGAVGEKALQVKDRRAVTWMVYIRRSSMLLVCIADGSDQVAICEEYLCLADPSLEADCGLSACSSAKDDNSAIHCLGVGRCILRE